MEASGEPPTSEEMLREILDQQRQHREEVAQLRKELDDARAPVVQQAGANVPTEDELQAARQQEIDAHEFYCPGCGALFDYRRACHGRGEAPHPPIDVVPTAELSGPPEGHTPAPASIDDRASALAH